MFLIHPVSVIPDSLRDTREFLWEELEWKKKYATTAVTLIPRTAATPVVFGGVFLGRSAFDIPQRDDKTKQERKDAEKLRQAKANELLATAKSAMSEGRWDMALKQAEAVQKLGLNLKEAAVVKAVALLELGDMAALSSMPVNAAVFEDAAFYASYIRQITKAKPAEKMSLLNLLDRYHPKLDFSPRSSETKAAVLPVLHDVLASILRDEERVLRIKGMQILSRYRHYDNKAKALLEAESKGSDPVLAEAARGFLYASP
jgi:hypothetical protein